MSYHLGIDLGTTFSAAAVSRDGRISIVELGSRSASIPSVVFLREDGTVLAGDQAQRRSVSEPHRVAREFKRRLGDTTPLLLGGSPYSADALTAHLLRWIVEQVVEREGAEPDSIAITHPANWGPYKIDLLQQAVRLAGLGDVRLATEPEAAVRHYADQERVEPGSVIAVYDLGGGTFDAALLRKTADGFEPLGRPEGIERLGGIDFDAAVIGHVMRALDLSPDDLDQDDPVTLQALARLRQDCVEAKEALSGDTDVSIPVMLPNLQTEVRLTRAEFESLVRPSLANSIDAMNRALGSADVAADEVSAVLLVGGSSRIPLIAQLVSNEFGRPVAIDADPKHAIALGAALLAADATLEASEAATVTASTALVDPDGADRLSERETPAEAVPAAGADPPDGAAVAPASPNPSGAASQPGSRSKTPVLVGAGLAAVAALVVGILVMQGSGGGDPENVSAADAAATTAAVADPPADTATTAPDDAEGSEAVATTPDATTDATDVTTTVASTTTTEPAPTTTVVQPTECPTVPERTACITSISVDSDGGLVAEYETEGYTPSLSPVGDHIHFYFDSVIDGDERNAGSEGTGEWRLWDGPNPFSITGGNDGRPGYTLAEATAAGATQLCSVVATATHAAVVGTGNCIDIPTSG